MEDLRDSIQEVEASCEGDTRSLWERPALLPEYDWAYDPQMPQEWNELVAAMCAQNTHQRRMTIRPAYHQPASDKVSVVYSLVREGKSLMAYKAAAVGSPLRLHIPNDSVTQVLAMCKQYACTATLVTLRDGGSTFPGAYEEEAEGDKPS